MKDNGDIPALTSMRFFAAFGVMFFHLGGPFITEINQRFPNAPWLTRPIAVMANTGYLGVSFFFVLSGFILSYVYGNDPGRLDAKRFWFARFARIYPTYLLGMLAAAPIIFLGQQARIENGEAPAPIVGSAIAAALLVHAWIAPVVVMWNLPSWSVAVEAFFYLLFPWMLPAIARRSLKAQLGIAASAWMAGLLLGFAYLWLSPDHLDQDHLWQLGPEAHGAWIIALKMNPVPHLPEFVVGIVSWHVFNALRARGWSTRGDAITVAGFALTTIAFWNADRLPYAPLHTGMLAPLFATVIVGLALGGNVARALSVSSLVLLGEASYAMYILHFPVSDLFRLGWVLTLGGFEGMENTVGMLAFLAVIPASILTYKAIEHPARMRLRRWYDGRIRVGVPVSSRAT